MTKKTNKKESKKTPTVDAQPQEVVEKKVVVVKPEKPAKKRSEALEADIGILEARIKGIKDEIAKEIPAPVNLKGDTDGFKEPSLATMHNVHTRADMKRIVEAFKIANPRKYALKKSSGELDRKLREAK